MDHGNDETSPAPAVEADETRLDETAIVPSVAHTSEPGLAWSSADVADHGAGGEGSWRDRLLWAGLIALLCAAVAAVVWFSATAYFQNKPTPNVAAPTAQVPAAPAPPLTPATTPAPPPVAAAPAPSPKLPTAVEGSYCRLSSTPTVDPGGVTVYCALFPEMPMTAFWSRTPGPLSWPVVDGERVPDQAGSYPWVVICEQQTGRTYDYCEKAIAGNTYQGDGPLSGD